MLANATALSPRVLPTDVAETNRQVYDDVAHQYEDGRTLLPPERSLLQRFRGRWDETDVLDLGVGAGRTAYTFGAIARSYVGLDYSAEMIEIARRTVGEDAHTRFVHGDARDLSEFHGRGFGLVMFSFNGIDYVDQPDRETVFAEVRKVLAPGGCFAFSSHSLEALPFRVTIDQVRERGERWGRGGPVIGALRASRSLVNTVWAQRANRELDLEAARERGWAMVRDEAHRFKLSTYYGLPSHQVRQLEEAGFADVEVLDRSGAPVSPDRPPADTWLDYVCTLP
jgi:ubiquinone/menaquinone biosynthesis C-methylase UbiE